MTTRVTEGRNEQVFYRSGQSFARGSTIDLWLTPDENALLYELWAKHPELGDPVGFQGGEVAITCEMIAAIPQIEIQKIFNFPKAKGPNEWKQKFGDRLYKTAVENAIV